MGGRIDIGGLGNGDCGLGSGSWKYAGMGYSHFLFDWYLRPHWVDDVPGERKGCQRS